MTLCLRHGNRLGPPDKSGLRRPIGSVEASAPPMALGRLTMICTEATTRAAKVRTRSLRSMVEDRVDLDTCGERLCDEC